MSTFSFVIPVYNVQEYLDQCVASVLGQTYPHLQVVLVDDGSTDGSGQKCDAWAAKDPRVTALHQPNQGLSAARNTGVDAATGDYVIFLDSDDYWITDTLLEKMAVRLQHSGTDVLTANYCKVTDGRMGAPYFALRQDMPQRSHGQHSLQFLMDNSLWIASACNKAVRRTLFDGGQLRFVKGITSEDIDWCLRLAVQARQFDFIADCMFAYRQRSDSLSHAMTLRKVSCQVQNIRACQDILAQAAVQQQKLLSPYLAYQCGTLFFNIALLADRHQRRAMCSQAKAFVPFMRHTADKRVLLVYIAARLFGVRAAVGLLRAVSALM